LEGRDEMGLFLSMTGVMGAGKAEVEAALKEYAAARGGRFEPTTKRTPPWEVLIVGEADGNTTVVYPGEFFEWDDAAAHLSQSLDVPVFSFHIHDDDLWMYVFFVAGEAVDQFNPIPRYWDDSLPEEECQEWGGNPRTIARWCPHIEETAIGKYLIPWDLENESPGRAYEDDEFTYGDCWQLVDFMRKLKISYPFTADGRVLGDTYLFEVEG
jgi:hypothetical protein